MSLKHRSEFIQSREVTVDNSVHHKFTVCNRIQNDTFLKIKSVQWGEVMD